MEVSTDTRRGEDRREADQKDQPKKQKTVESNLSPSTQEGHSKEQRQSKHCKRSLESGEGDDKEDKRPMEANVERSLMMTPQGGSSDAMRGREKERRISKEGSKDDESATMEDGEVESQGNIYSILPTEEDLLEDIVSFGTEEDMQPSPGKKLKKKIASPPVATRRSERVKEKETIPILAMQRQKKRNLDISTVKGSSSSSFPDCIKFPNMPKEDLIHISSVCGSELGNSDEEISNNINIIIEKEIGRATKFIEEVENTKINPISAEEMENETQRDEGSDKDEGERLGVIEEKALKEIQSLDKRKKKKK